MPRVARVVVPEVAHHVTQRGTGRQLVFYTRGDRVSYLRLLKGNCERAGLRVLAYCLMAEPHPHDRGAARVRIDGGGAEADAWAVRAILQCEEVAVGALVAEPVLLVSDG